MAKGNAFSLGDVTRAGVCLRDFVYRDTEYESDEEREQIFSKAAAALQIAHWWRDQHARPLATASNNLRYHVGKVTGEQPQVTQRLKRVPTIIDKLHRIETMELGRMWDIGGVRARVPTVGHVYEVVDRLRRWKFRGKHHDYIKNPKDDGYRAYHLYVEKQGRVIEVQIRTENQDTWANQVERDGRMGAQGYKFGRGEPVVRDYYRVVAEVFAEIDAQRPIAPDLRARLQASRDRVLALNPKPPGDPQS